MNWIDTPLFVYANLQGHPARGRSGSEIDRDSSASTPLVLIECYSVLTRDYGAPTDETASYIDRLARSRLQWANLDQIQASSAVGEHHNLGIQSTDALLLTLAREDGGTLVTTDRRLLRRAEAQGVAIRNPIDTALAAEVARWEAEHLPPKGLGRVLTAVERWLRRQDQGTAERFIEATGGLRTPPL